MAEAIACDNCVGARRELCEIAFASSARTVAAYVALNQTMNQMAGMIGEQAQHNQQVKSLDRQEIVASRAKRNVTRNLGNIGCELDAEQAAEKLQQFVDKTGLIKD